MTDQPISPSHKKSFWRRGIAGLLDFITVFFVGGYVIGALTGETTSDGFHLTGLAAFTLFALIFLYFYAGWKVVGGTLWQRVLGAR